MTWAALPAGTTATRIAVVKYAFRTTDAGVSLASRFVSLMDERWMEGVRMFPSQSGCA